MIDKVESFIKSDPDHRFAIITFKFITDLIGEQLLDRYPNLTEIHNYGAIEGLDQISENADTIILIGNPEVRPIDIKRRSQAIYAKDPNPLSFETTASEDGEIDRYKDRRVQDVWESMVQSELAQAAGRARLNSKENKTLLLFTAQYLPGYKRAGRLF